MITKTQDQERKTRKGTKTGITQKSELTKQRKSLVGIQRTNYIHALVATNETYH